MEIREATEMDIPDIVGLLKTSLGEHLMPKSERYWRWKHLENPFGRSHVILCWDGSVLVGVRAFMRWEWNWHGNIYNSVRAVDTATHPNWQGKGIFRKLTLALVDYCRKSGEDFVFNTPNEKSKPGYLKMGWVEAGKLPVRVSIQRPRKVIGKVLRMSSSAEWKESGTISQFLEHRELSSLLMENENRMNGITTKMSPAYLRWRYLDVPVASYVGIGQVEQNLAGLIVGRIKDTRFGRELRITDYFLKGSGNTIELVGKLDECRKKWEVDYTTISGTVLPFEGKGFPALGVRTTIGPFVTIRALRLNDLSSLMSFNHWLPSLGDLELF